jgi:ankyrin repeat protein
MENSQSNIIYNPPGIIYNNPNIQVYHPLTIYVPQSLINSPIIVSEQIVPNYSPIYQPGYHPGYQPIYQPIFQPMYHPGNHVQPIITNPVNYVLPVSNNIQYSIEPNEQIDVSIGNKRSNQDDSNPNDSKKNRINQEDEEEDEEEEELEEDEEEDEEEQDHTYLIDFIKNDDSNSLREALTNGINPNVSVQHHNYNNPDPVITTLLNLSCILEKIEFVNLLLEFGADSNIEDEWGLSGIVYACRANRLDIARLLIASNPNLNLDFPEDNLLYWALKNNNFDLVFELVQADQNHQIALEWDISNLKDDLMYLALESAEKDNVELFEKGKQIINYILVSGYDINELTEFEDFPLLIAANMGNIKLMEFLIANGADINNQDNSGNTCLMNLAKCNEDVGIIKYLLEKGADMLIENKSGYTVFTEPTILNNQIFNFVEYRLELLLYSLDYKGLLKNNNINATNIFDIIEFL